MVRVFLLLGVVSALFQNPPIPSGVPLSLAEDRAARVSDVRYELRFDVPADQAAPVKGTATVRFSLKDATRPLALDFAGPSASLRLATGDTVRVENEHFVVPPSALTQGENVLRLEFESADAPLNRNPEFLYALFVPARARQAFPCFDQPDLKARYTLSLGVPAAWETITNAAERSRQKDGDRTVVQFEETKPIPSYLFTFAAGRFQVETSTRGDRPFRMLHRETDAAKVARNRDAIFDLHATALDWLERYTGIPYPFGKFEFLLVPSFQFGGMEHPGSIFYNASALLLDPSATQNQKLGRASLIAHETAHMWFGDLVTMRWFDDVWMKEVFANFMAAKIVNPSFPEINHDLRFLYSHYPAAYDVDRTAGTNPIRQPLANLNEAGSLYGAIIYQKAPIVMRQLEMMLGEGPFQEGVREYLKQFSFANATWPDLIALLDPRTPADLSSWSHAWVNERGRPTIETRITRADNGSRVSITQSDPYAARGLAWTQTFSVAVGYQRDGGAERVTLSGPSVAVKAGGPVRYVLPNARGDGYGNFVLDPVSRAHLMANSPGDELTRGAMLVMLWEEMVDGRIPAADMFDKLLRDVAVEPSELTVQRMLTYAQQAYWKWLSPEQRRARAARAEQVLRAGLTAAGTQSVKSAWFNAVRDMATTAPTLEWLESVWRGTGTVAGLELAEPDFITLAQELALRGVRNADDILATQIERTKNPDRKARLIFVRPALSADRTVRDAFFATLAGAENRRREPWVLEAVGYLHHPLRAETAQALVRPSLELLREIQRTGDIFFPKRWMDATLSGHRSAAVAATVRTFIDGLPKDYPDRLRRIVLSSADDLFRVSRTATR